MVSWLPVLVADRFVRVLVIVIACDEHLFIIGNACSMPTPTDRNNHYLAKSIVQFYYYCT